MKSVDSFRVHKIKCWPEPYAAIFFVWLIVDDSWTRRL